jgi:hypothetical protein
LLVHQIFRYYDLNPESRPVTAKIVHKLLEVSAIELSQQEREQLKDIFELFGGGSIEATEMDAAMLALGIKTSKHIQSARSSQNAYERDMDSDFKMIDKDGSKTITLDEFTAMMTGEHGHWSLGGSLECVLCFEQQHRKFEQLVCCSV